jgi:hypothetical protein
MDALRNASRLFFALAFVVALGCTSSPTEPKGSGGTPQTPKPPPPTVSFSVSVTANPTQLTEGSPSASNIVVNVVRSDGQGPADGSVVHVTTTLGGFGSIGGPNAVDLQLVNGRAAAALFPSATDTGTAAVTATFTPTGSTTSFTGAANVRISQAATFFISSVSPGVGNPNGGDTVQILGGGFVAPVRVTFNGATATVKSTTGSAITVATPSAAAAGVSVGVGQTAPVTVAVTINLNKPNQLMDSIPQGFTYSLGGGTQQPSVFSVTPTLGTNDGGTVVTILGDGFEAPVQVLFGLGTSATSFNGVEATVQSVTANKIVVVTPAATGFGSNLRNTVVNLLVKNVNSGFSTVASQVFKYGTNVQITAMSQGSGSAAGGTRVAIDGSGFSAPVAVSFTFSNVSVAQQVVSVTGTQIVILTSPAPIPAQCPANGLISSTAVSETNISTGDGATASIGFNFAVDQPVVSSVSPISANNGAATALTITGSGFTGSSQVIFGDPASGITVAPTSVSADGTTIKVNVPTEPTSFFPTAACGTGGTMMLRTTLSITVTNSDDRCTSTFRNGFTLIPDESCHVPQPTPPVANFTAQVLNAATHTMQFLDSSTNTPTSWSWDFGDPASGVVLNTSTAQNPSHTYTAAGNFTVKLVACNAGGCSAQKAAVVAVP